MLRLDTLPTRPVPDWRAVADLAHTHGAVLFPLDAIPSANGAHSSLYKFDCGCYAAYNEAGEHVGWRISAITRRNKRG
jgi:hypothetical protein